MYCLSDYIKGKIKKGSMDGIIFPSYDEYKDFFNEFDEVKLGHYVSSLRWQTPLRKY